MTVLRAERMVNLYKVIESIVMLPSNRGHYKTLAYASWTHERGLQAKPYTTKEFYQVLNTINLTYISFALCVDSRE